MFSSLSRVFRRRLCGRWFESQSFTWFCEFETGEDVGFEFVSCMVLKFPHVPDSTSFDFSTSEGLEGDGFWIDKSEKLTNSAKYMGFKIEKKLYEKVFEFRQGKTKISIHFEIRLGPNSKVTHLSLLLCEIGLLSCVLKLFVLEARRSMYFESSLTWTIFICTSTFQKDISKIILLWRKLSGSHFYRSFHKHIWKEKKHISLPFVLSDLFPLTLPFGYHLLADNKKAIKINGFDHTWESSLVSMHAYLSHHQ